MIYFYDASGDVTRCMPERVYQGSAEANNIAFVAPYAADAQIYIAFQLPDGRKTEMYKMEFAAQMKGLMSQDYKDLFCWRIALPVSVTARFGKVTAQFYRVGTDSQIYATAPVEFVVERGISGSLPEKPDDNVYRQILSRIAQIEADVENAEYPARSVYAWNSTYTYAVNEIVFCPTAKVHGAFVRSKEINTNQPPYSETGELNAQYWAEVFCFNDVFHQTQIAVAMKDLAAKSAEEAKNNAGLADAAKNDAQKNANLASSAKDDARKAVSNAASQAIQAEESNQQAKKSAAAAELSAQRAEKAAQNSSGITQEDLNNAVFGKQDKSDSALQTTAKTVVGAINELNAKPSGAGDVTSQQLQTVADAKQDKNDPTLQTTAKTVVGAINELNSKSSSGGVSKGELDAAVAGKQDKNDSSLNTTSKTVTGAVNELNTAVIGKQDKTDNGLQTTAKTVVGAINELNSKASSGGGGAIPQATLSTLGGIKADVQYSEDNQAVRISDDGFLWTRNSLKGSNLSFWYDFPPGVKVRGKAICFHHGQLWLEDVVEQVGNGYQNVLLVWFDVIENADVEVMDAINMSSGEHMKFYETQFLSTLPTKTWFLLLGEMRMGTTD